MISFDKASGKFKCSINGNKFTTSKQDYIEYMFKKITGVKATFAEISEQQKPQVSDKFGINERFGFVEKLVNMVSSGVQPSAVITGQGGLGKTYTVMKTLQSAGIQDYNDVVRKLAIGSRIDMSKLYVTIKGYSTPKGLFRTLFENNRAVIVFDDCDSILKDPVALNLLKGALDSYGKRIISWNAESFGKDDDLPRSFEFKGKVIFISNMDQDSIDQAIRSRSMMIDLSMTDDQKIDRMEFIAKSDEFLPEYTAEEKADALGLIREIKDEVKEISLRTLISVTKIRSANKDWKDLATYVLCN
jgi:Cdc6-like AAA superfamily ATPase